MQLNKISINTANADNSQTLQKWNKTNMQTQINKMTGCETMGKTNQNLLKLGRCVWCVCKGVWCDSTYLCR